MDTDKISTTPAGETADIAHNTDSFTKVKSKKCQKRKREQDGADMDTEESVVSKRPQFPPISGDKLTVSSAFLRERIKFVFIVNEVALVATKSLFKDNVWLSHCGFRVKAKHI